MKKMWLSGLAMASGLLLSGAAPAQEITIGVAGPMTGQYASFGQQLKNGAEMAVADINAAGGVNGQKLKLEIGDDACDPKQARAVAEKLAGMKVPFVAGHFCSSSSIPASDAYAESNVLQITPASTNPQFTERKLWNTFRTCGRDDQQGAVAGDYIIKNFKDKKVAVVHDKTTYGQGLADETRKTMNKGGVKEVLYEGINIGDKDFSALVSKIKAAGADLVYWGGLHTEGGLLVRQMRDQGVKAVLMGADGITSDEFASIGGPGVEGTLMTFAPDPRKRADAKEVIEKFRAKKFEPEAYTLYSYASVQIIQQAAEAAKSLDPKKVAAQIKSGQKFKTVLGELSFDKKGDITRPDYVMYVWKKGKDGKITYEEIETKPRS